ncbi:MAG: endonuclease i [Bacteroidetes bacterium OLB12]|nr:MAG: endonuclease i [Bacteroidetes bacterium OLB12]
MKKICIILFSLFNASVCFAQVTDDFTDGDLTNNPEWTPDNAANWVVVSNQLRSNSAVASSSFYITTPSSRATNSQWEFWVNLQFNTSSANVVDVFLMADQANLTSATLNGYFVRIGGTPDEISLYKIVNGTPTLIINGTDGVTNASNNTVRIKVVCDADNLWTLQRDATGGASYFTEGTVTDNTILTSQFFGIRVQQSTASFFNRHFFDDIYVGEIIVDTTPPTIQFLGIENPFQVQVGFDELLQVASAQSVANYSASNGLGFPSTAQLQPNKKVVLLTFAKEFQSGVTYQLTVTNVSDAAGNVMAETTLPFEFVSSFSYKDIILTEIFADPTPQIGLPDAEFIEVYNRSANPIDLAGWRFTDGSSTATLPVHILMPTQYLILTSTANASLYNSYGMVLGLANFPTINNAGEALRLFAPGNQLIDSVNFNLSWYADEDKQAGGWTLELIDLQNICGEETNWVASEAPQGGTPGHLNSVHTDKPDLTGPKLLSVAVPSETELILTFDEKLEVSVSQHSFSFEPPLTISEIKFTSTSLRQLRITLSNTLQPKQLYSITISGLRDCAGNLIQDGYSQKKFALPELAEAGDVVLNEVLFNPRPGGVDFVEILNVSDKYINLKNWSLANFENGEIRNAKIMSTNDVLLSPASFLAITPNGVVLKDHYPLAMETNFLIATIPSLNDDAGSVALVSDSGLNLDYLIYEDDFHTSLLKDKEGVSLERISAYESALKKNNWKSAASAAGFATPGYINSNSKPEGSFTGDEIQVDPEIFSVDRPGQDFARIRYKFDQSGWVANVKIADQQGRVIKELANNETLGIDGFFRWDGDREDGTRARMGYYFVWVELFQLDGQVRTYRKRVVIAR